jgi:hypothetical protein
LREPSFASRVKVHFNVAVEVPVVGRVLRVPYECQNGRRSLLLPKLFSAMRGMDAAIMLACEGDLIQRHAARPGTTKLFVLPTYEDAETEAELGGAVSRIMGEYKVRTVSRQEIPELVGEVQRGDH